MTSGCDLLRVSLGAYAVDALSPAEWARVGAHLECCEDCKSELAELREVAGLLAAVPLREVGGVGLAGGDRFQSATDQRARRAQGGRVRRAVPAVAVVAALVAAVMALGSPGGGPRSSYERGSLIASSTDPATHVFARVTLRRRVWGTAASLSMRGVRPDLRCRLVILTLNGSRDLVATYRTDSDGTADLTTGSPVPITTIASLEVLAGTRQLVVQIPVHGSRSAA